LNSLGNRIRTLRLEKKLSQEQLAEACEISVISLRHFEKSRRIPNVTLLVRFCNVLEVSPEYLLQDSLTLNTTSDDKNEIISFINKLTPQQAGYMKDWCKITEKHLVNGNITP